MKKTGKMISVLLTLALVLCTALPAAAAAPGEQKTVKIGFFSSEGYHQMDDAQVMSGYGYDFLQMLLRYNDWSYEYIGYDKNWGDMLALLDTGEIDLVTLANKTPEREEKYDYSAEAIGTSATILTMAAQNEEIVPGSYAGYDGARVGLVEGSSHNEKFAAYAAEKGFDYTPVYYSDINDLLADLRAGQGITMAVTSNMRVVRDEVILDEFGQTPYYAIVKKGNEELLSQLDEGIAQLDVYSPDWRTELFNRYYADVNSEVLSLSAEEREYLRQLQADGTVLKAAMNPELGPYAYFENGEAGGIVPTIFEEVASRLGLKYEILYSADRSAYKQQLQSGEADIDLTAYQDFGIAQKYGLKETDAYLTSCLAMVTRSGEAINAATMTVAAVNDPTEYAAYNNDLIYQNPSKQYASLQECVDAVKNGACDATFLYAYSAEQMVSADYTHRLQYTILPKYSFGLTLGVQNAQDHRLLSVLNKAVKSISSSYAQSITLEEITRQQSSVSFGSLLYSHPVLIVLAAVALVAVLAAAAIALVVYRNQRQVRLANNKLNRFILYVCEDYDLVTEMNLKDRVRIDYHIEDGQLVEKSYPYVPLVAADYAKIARPEDIEKILATSDEATVGKMIDEGGRNYFEVQIKDASGNYRWYSYLLRAVAKDAQHPKNYIMFKRDIQETKDAAARQQQNLRDALQAAKTASAAKGQFLSRVSHEIRTPLNAIIGYMELARDADATPDKVQHCVDNADVAAQHLLSIINDVLDISAIESGRMRVAHEEFNLKDLITALSTLFYNQARGRGVRFEVQLRGITQEWVVGDKLRVNQVLMNLLSNALKFTPEGGSVTLKIEQRRRESGKVFLQFEVSDTGIGMSQEFMARLFQSFEQESASTAQKYGGTGLGLSISRNLVEMMGGSIAVHSVQGKGSTFTVLLHFDESDREHGADRVLDFSHVRALVVDDEKDEGTYLKATLKRCGVRADVVADGSTALKRLRSRAGTDYAYDLCIMDWKMPGMNGVETAEKIRAEFGQELPIIIATAYDAVALEDEAKAAGVNRVISKPLFQSTLFDLLAVTFGQRGAPEKKTAAAQKRDLHGVRLLLAEDNPMNMEIAVAVLQKAGAIITQAKDGGEVCDLFLNAPPGTFDMILMDIQMPVMDGYAATRKIRESGHPQAAAIPIVAMTANAFAEDVAQALTSGMNAHIAKPVNYEKLYEIMDQYHLGEDTNERGTV